MHVLQAILALLLDIEWISQALGNRRLIGLFLAFQNIDKD